jgi:hypothetical protein
MEEDLPEYRIHEHASCFRCQKMGAVIYKGWVFYCPSCHQLALEEED